MAPHWLAAIGNFFKSVLGLTIKSEAFKVLVQTLMPLAINTVLTLDSAIGQPTGAEKRAAAYVSLSSAAKQAGLDFKKHMIYALIELAVLKVNKTIGEE